MLKEFWVLNNKEESNKRITDEGKGASHIKAPFRADHGGIIYRTERSKQRQDFS